MNEILENIKNRRSVRRYLPEQIKEDELDLILEAARYAPSGHNCQPWYFTVIQNKVLIDYMSDKIKELMAESSEEWIVKMGAKDRFHVFYNAPTIIVVSGKKDAYSPMVDCCAAIQNMLLMGESIGIGSCFIGLTNFFFQNEEECKRLDLPEGYTPYYTVCLGYKAINRTIPFPARKTEIVNYIR